MGKTFSRQQQVGERKAVWFPLSLTMHLTIDPKKNGKKMIKALGNSTFEERL